MGDYLPGSLGSSAGTQSAGRAILVAVALGALGPGLAYLVARGLGRVISGGDLPALALLAILLLSVVVIPYACFAGVALGYLRYRGLSWADIRSYLGISRPDIRDFIVIVGAWLFAIVLVFLALLAVVSTGVEPAQNQNVPQGQGASNVLLLLVPVMLFVVGPVEEILYRGAVQGRLRESLGPIPAILIASAIFAVAHVLALTGGLVGRMATIMILFIPGILLGATYEYTRNLTVPVIIHGLYNSTLLILAYVALNAEGGSQASQPATSILTALPL